MKMLLRPGHRRRLGCLLAVLGALLLGMFLVGRAVGPRPQQRAKTLSHMKGLCGLVLRYAAERRELPATLADALPEGGRRAEFLRDGWGRPIRYLVVGETVTLRSLGADGEPGGRGQDSDIELTFDVAEGADVPPPTEQGRKGIRRERGKQGQSTHPPRKRPHEVLIRSWFTANASRPWFIAPRLGLATR